MGVLLNGQDEILRDIQRDAEYAEEHAHHKVRWWGKKAIQGVDDWAVPLDTGLALLYRATSGAGVYGADAGDTAQLFGATDIPIPGMVVGDFDEILVVVNSSSTLYLCRILWAATTVADAIAAGNYSEFPYFRATADTTRLKAFVPTPLIGADQRVWLQCMNATNNATMDFVVGVHGYNF
jgi:hypothetical protein